MGKNDKPLREPGENRKKVLSALEAWNRPRVDTKDPKAIEQRIDEYLHYCVENDIAPGVAGCASWLGVAYRTLEGWYTGYRGSPEHQRVASKLYGLLQNIWEQDMHDGTINTIGGIYTSKVFFGMRDTQEVVVNQTVTHELPSEDLLKEARQLPGAEKFFIADGKTIDADYKVLEDDYGYERSMERAEKAKARKAAIEANKPIRKQRQKEYLKEYYKEHKEEQLERNRKSKARKAQKAAEQKKDN